MKLNTHQQQLLHILNVKTLTLNAEFQQFALTPLQQPALSSNKSEKSTAEITEFAVLSSDIRLLLSQLTPELSWQIAPDTSCCSCEADVLITPELNLLQQSHLKRQLWQLLNPRLHDV